MTSDQDQRRKERIAAGIPSAGMYGEALPTWAIWVVVLAFFGLPFTCFLVYLVTH